MLGELDSFPFVLGLDLGKSLGEIRALPHQEIVAWRAFYRVRREMAKLES